jgi:hypothetical protein
LRTVVITSLANAWLVGTLTTALWGATVWRGFRRLRRAQANLAPGEELDCRNGTCQVA